MVERIQWVISLAVLIFGIALLPVMGVTAFLFIVMGIAYCCLAALASRTTIIPVLLSLLADCYLIFFSWNVLAGLDAVPINAKSQGRVVTFTDYLTLDTVAAVVILVLVSFYLVTVVINWKNIISMGWV